MAIKYFIEFQVKTTSFIPGLFLLVPGLFLLFSNASW